jgi:hypothetical protein
VAIELAHRCDSSTSKGMNVIKKLNFIDLPNAEFEGRAF